MSKKYPEFVLRHRTTGVIYGVSPIFEDDPEMEKIPFAEAHPELCMPEHTKKAVAKKKAPAKKKAKPKLDLVTEDIPEDPDEILEESLSDQISEALGEEATRGLD